MKRPHVLMLISDEHSPHYTSYENHPVVRTPNLQRLHDSGVNCANAYCNSPICAPSRASQISGKFCRNNGVTDWFQDLHPGTPTLPGWFQRHGYETVAFGKMHFYGDQLKGWGERPLGDLYDPVTSRPVSPERNLDHLIGSWERRGPKRGWYDAAASLAEAGPGNNPSLNRDAAMFDAGLHRLRQRFAKGEPQQPLFLGISALIPHYPFVCPPALFDYYRERVTLPEVDKAALENLHPAYQKKIAIQTPEPVPEEHQLNAIAAYCGMVEFLDQQIGRALDTLEELGIADDFIVVHWSDHGDMMGEHGQWWKRSFYEASARVPLLFQAPGRITAGHAIEKNVSLVDLFPTLCDLCGLPAPAGLDGHSFAAQLRGEEDAEWPDLAFSENWQPAMGEEFVPAYMVKKGSCKLTQFGPHPDRLLHDLSRDPGETCNLIKAPEYAGILADLEQELARILLPKPMVPARTLWP